MYEARFWLLVLGLVYCWCYCLPFEYPKLYTRKFLILISFCTAQHFSLTFISYLVIFFSGFLHAFHSLFWEEISAFAAVDRCYVMGTCYHVIYSSFASYGGYIICACLANKAKCQKAELQWEYWSGKKVYNVKRSIYKVMIYISNHTPYHGFKIIAA